MTRRWLAWSLVGMVALGVLAGCGAEAAFETPPPLDVCAVDTDCVLAPAPASFSTPCCTGLETQMFSQAYLDWLGRYRATRCDEVSCPTQPATWPLEACAREPRCIASRCGNACTP